MTQPILNVIAGLYFPFAHEKITVDNTAGGKALTKATYDPVSRDAINNNARQAQRAVITVETAQIRYRYDGGAPTDAVGHILNSGDVVTLIGYAAINQFRAIRTGGTSGVIVVTYER